MSENQGQQAQPKAAAVPAFAVEFANNRGRVQFVRTLQRKFRGRWETADVIKRPGGARDGLGDIQGVPDIPGVVLRIDPGRGTITVYDPLEKNAKLRDDIKKALNRNRTRGMLPIVEEATEEISADKLKTLVVELAAIHKNKHLNVVEGSFPGDKQIEALPGREFYDPGREDRAPRYKDEAAKYFQRASTVGV